MDNVIRSRPCPDCYVCGSIGTPLYSALPDRIFGVPGTWNFSLCSNPECGLVWLDPAPLEDEISKAYNIYYTHSERRHEQFFYWLVRVGLARITWLRRWERKSSYMTLEHETPGLLLDIGCGSGVFLERMRAMGWDVEGVDFDAQAVKRARTAGLEVHYGEVTSMKYSENRFDAVTMNHVIEHVFDPIGLLQECHRILKGGGRLIVVTPNVSSRAHQQFGSSWRDLDPPRHIRLFSPGTLRNCAERSGFLHIKTWTSAANASLSWAGSLDIKETGRHNMLRDRTFQTFLRSYIGQYQEYFALSSHPLWGEEAVLTAEKSRC